MRTDGENGSRKREKSRDNTRQSWTFGWSQTAWVKVIPSVRGRVATMHPGSVTVCDAEVSGTPFVLLASIQKSLAVEKNNGWFLIMSVWPLPDPNSPDVSELKEWGQCQGEIRQSEVHPSPSPPPTITNDSASRTGHCIFHSQWLYNSCIIDVVEDMSVAQSVA